MLCARAVTAQLGLGPAGTARAKAGGHGAMTSSFTWLTIPTARGMAEDTPGIARGLGVSVERACDLFSQVSEGVSGALSGLPAVGLSTQDVRKARKSW